MDGISKLLIFFGDNTPYISFFGAIIGGEETLIVLSIYSAKGVFDIVSVLVFFYLGIMVSDTMWYLIGKSKLFTWLIKFEFMSLAYDKWGRLLDSATEKNNFQALFFTKFLYGFRIPTIMYLARERLSLQSFLKYSIYTNFLWVVIIFLVGFVTGKGISSATYFSDNVTIEIFLVGIILILFATLMKIISKKTTQWLKKK